MTFKSFFDQWIAQPCIDFFRAGRLCTVILVRALRAQRKGIKALEDAIARIEVMSKEENINKKSVEVFRKDTLEFLKVTEECIAVWEIYRTEAIEVGLYDFARFGDREIMGWQRTKRLAVKQINEVDKLQDFFKSEIKTEV